MSAAMMCDRCGFSVRVLNPDLPMRLPMGWTRLVITPTEAFAGPDAASDESDLCEGCTGQVREVLAATPPDNPLNQMATVEITEGPGR